MSSIVLELQEAAYTSNTSLSELIRKAYFIAKKLDLESQSEWLRKELNGYKEGDDIPEYRILNSSIQAKAWNGWISVIDPSGFFDSLKKVPCVHSIGEVEVIYQAEGTAYMKYPDTTIQLLMEATRNDTDFRGKIPVNEYLRVLDTVRNDILDWALDLEKKGILGENLSFTKAEVMKAQNIYSTTNNYNGDMTKSQIHNNNSGQLITNYNETLDPCLLKEFIEELKERKNLINFDSSESRIDFEKQITIVNEEVNSAVPQNGKIFSALSIIKKIIEKVTSDIITRGILHTLHQLM